MGSVQPSPHSSPGPHSGVSALTVQGLPPVDDDLAIVAADSGKETINDARAILGHVAIRCHILVSVCPCHPTRQHWEKLKRGERGGEERGFKAALQGAAAPQEGAWESGVLKERIRMLKRSFLASKPRMFTL